MICHKCGIETETKSTRKVLYYCQSCAAKLREYPRKKKPIPICPVCKKPLTDYHYKCWEDLTIEEMALKAEKAYRGKITYRNNGFWLSNKKLADRDLTRTLRFMFFVGKVVRAVKVQMYINNGVDDE